MWVFPELLLAIPAKLGADKRYTSKAGSRLALHRQSWEQPGATPAKLGAALGQEETKQLRHKPTKPAKILSYQTTTTYYIIGYWSGGMRGALE